MKDHERSLKSLFGGYFNQDFEEIGDWKGSPSTHGVAAFIKDDNFKVAEGFADSLRWLLQKNLPDKELAAAIEGYGADYNPVGRGFSDEPLYKTTRSWIEELIRQLSSSSGTE